MEAGIIRSFRDPTTSAERFFLLVMDFQRTIAHPTRKNEKIIVSWTKGYRLLTVHYRDELIAQIEDIDLLFNGYTTHHELLGEVEIHLMAKPYILNIMIDGMHTVSNDRHPVYSIYSNSLLFIIPSILNLIIISAIWDSRLEHALGMIELIALGFSTLSFIFFISCTALILTGRFQAIYFGIILLLVQAGSILLLMFFSAELYKMRMFIYLMVSIHLIGSYFVHLNYKEYKRYVKEETDELDVLDSDL
jgi:hypothetical protein